MVENIREYANLTLLLNFGRIESVPQNLGTNIIMKLGEFIVKSILKKLFLVSFLFILSITCSTYIYAEEKIEELQVYQIRSKDEGIITDKQVFSFYEENNEKLSNLIEQRKQEEAERIEAERIEAERVENERIEAERIEKEKQMEQEKEVAPHIESTSEIANFALQFVGNPYVAGGTSLTNGADCSGFVMSVYANFGISLPRTTNGQAQSGYGVSIDEAQPGDIVSYGYNGNVSHSALYIGNGMIVHASTPSLGIRVDSMYIMPIVTIRRIG